MAANSAAGDGVGNVHRFAEQVYDELRQVAQLAFRAERRDHTLQPTAVVNEAFLRLMASETLTVNDRQHFFRLAARAMRRILVSHARDRNRLRRSGRLRRVDLEQISGSEATPSTDLDPYDLETLDEALRDLEHAYERSARVVELRYFAGLGVEETASALDISAATVKREWQFAKAWLFERLRPT